jgi:uncharacterized protein YbjQ (UPF0145 family)
MDGYSTATDIKVSTTMELDGFKVKEYKGIVRGLIVRTPTIAQGFLGTLNQIIGGQIGAYTEMCEQARSEAFDRLIAHAREVGANAVLGMRYDSSDLGPGVTEVLCYGTAAIVVPA